MNELELVKCPNCEWVHFLSDNDGLDQCFRCYWSVKHMIPAEDEDCPRGSTMQPVNRVTYEGE